MDNLNFENGIKRCANLASEKGIRINLATLIGVNNDTKKIASIVKSTNGVITSVVPGRKGGELTKEVICTDVDMKFRIHHGLCFKNVD